MLFDSSLRKDLSRTFSGTLVVILTIVLTMFLIRTLGQAAGGKVSPQDVVMLLGFTALMHLPTMLSLSLFVSVVLTLGRMYRDSEMTIWFASGVGLASVVRPVVRMATPALLLVTLLSLLVWPWVNQQVSELKDRYERRSDLSRVAPGQFQTSRDGTKVFFIERGNSDGTGRNVFILTNQGERESVTSARTGRIDNTPEATFLALDNGQRNEQNTRTGEKTVARFDNYKVLVGQRTRENIDSLPPKARPTLELVASPDPRARGELAWRIGLALGSANMVLLGIGLSATHPRRASNWNLLFALLTFVVYYNLINLSRAWVASGKFGLGSTLLAVHGTALALALGLVWWRDHGTHFSLRRRQALPPDPLGASA